MTEIVYLSRQEVSDLLPPIPEQIDLVAGTYRSMAAGRVELPPKPGIHPRQDAFIHAMPAYLEDTDVAAIKWVSGYPSNKALGLPYINGLMIVNDAATGMPIAIMDAAEITAARTAAASGACIRHWAPAGWTRAAIIGCGEQGRYHARDDRVAVSGGRAERVRPRSRARRVDARARHRPPERARRPWPAPTSS